MNKFSPVLDWIVNILLFIIYATLVLSAFADFRIFVTLMLVYIALMNWWYVRETSKGAYLTELRVLMIYKKLKISDKEVDALLESFPPKIRELNKKFLMEIKDNTDDLSR